MAPLHTNERVRVARGLDASAGGENSRAEKVSVRDSAMPTRARAATRITTGEVDIDSDEEEIIV
jgi:hypothetical protein